MISLADNVACCLCVAMDACSSLHSTTISSSELLKLFNPKNNVNYFRYN